MDQDNRRKERKREKFTQEVRKKEIRKIKHRRQKDRSPLFGLGLFGIVGWSVAIPTLIGVAVGIWMDARWHDHVSWTLTMLFAGVILGCLNAWYWVKREIGRD